MPAIWLPALIMLVVALTAGPARSQNLDHDKSGAKLFAASCADCHRSPRGLAKQRLTFMLSYYLRQHYTSSSASAQVLAAYLQSVDAPPAKPATRKAQTADRKPPATSASVLRPPALVPPR